MTGIRHLAAIGLVVLSLAGLLACGWALGIPLRGEVGTDRTALAEPPAGPARRPAALDSLVPALALFRPTRKPAPTAFDPMGNQPTVPVVESQPAFVLVGLVLGAARAAVIRGIPGLEAAQVLGEGDERAGLRVIRIDRAGVSAVWRGDSLRLALPREGM
jgi:hypothetical protein